MRCSYGAASWRTYWACWRKRSNCTSFTARRAVSSAIAFEAIAGRRRKSVRQRGFKARLAVLMTLWASGPYTADSRSVFQVRR